MSAGRVVDWGEQPPEANLNYGFDLTDWIAKLSAGDSIASVEVTGISPVGLTVGAPNWSVSPLVSVFVTGGTHRTRYSITIKVTSAGAPTPLIDEFVALIGIVDPALEVADRTGPNLVG